MGYFPFIQIKVRNKLYESFVNNLYLQLNEQIVVQTEYGIELGVVYTRHQRNTTVIEKQPLIKIIRRATKQDQNTFFSNIRKTIQIRNKVKSIINEHKLCMKLVHMYYILNCSKLFLYYTSNIRIDFRVFIKNLGNILKTKIQMVQIGVRDEPKIIGGIGICGQVVCCKKFLTKFDSVTVNMIKDQHISLNINKLSGFCDRLKCCMSYEQDNTKKNE
ncbi:MAG: hypothetical protein LBM05_00930 [Endomicrobium sp.]|jgi:cell fate regulator YaaT (PSP1 superfamily)|nr:hypothetical protein [Endomicrobium sp.]